MWALMGSPLDRMDSLRRGEMGVLEKTYATPGMHPDFKLTRFVKPEQEILKKLEREWYLTNSGSDIRLGHSDYRFFLMKPTRSISEMFNLERELIVVFDRYRNFEPQTLDAFDAAQERLPSLRVETACRILISKDLDIESKIEALLKADPDQPSIIPFCYSELLFSSYSRFFIRNRFKQHFCAQKPIVKTR